MMYRNHTGGLALLEPHHSKHVSAMTTEALHSKADIAAELAARDARIAELEEANEMGCESPPPGCDCPGCSLVRQKNEEM